MKEYSIFIKKHLYLALKCSLVLLLGFESPLLLLRNQADERELKLWPRQTKPS